MSACKVTEIWRYPVKSLQGERLESTAITDVVPGDRSWGVVDTETGKLLSAKTVPALLSGSARIDDEGCLITLPDGTATGSGDGEVDMVLSRWLGRPVRLAGTEPGTVHAIDIEWDEGQDDPGDLPVFEFPTQPGWFYDSTSSLHLIGTATLAHVDANAGPGAGAVERFRPNVVVATDRPYEEDEWVDATIAVGTATAWVKKATDRCVLITRALPGHDASRDALRFLSRDHGRNAGISAQPRTPGTVSVGDAVG